MSTKVLISIYLVFLALIGLLLLDRLLDFVDLVNTYNETLKNVSTAVITNGSL